MQKQNAALKTYELTTKTPHNVKLTVFNSIQKGKRREKLVP